MKGYGSAYVKAQDLNGNDLWYIQYKSSNGKWKQEKTRGCQEQAGVLTGTLTCSCYSPGTPAKLPALCTYRYLFPGTTSLPTPNHRYQVVCLGKAPYSSVEQLKQALVVVTEGTCVPQGVVISGIGVESDRVRF